MLEKTLFAFCRVVFAGSRTFALSLALSGCAGGYFARLPNSLELPTANLVVGDVKVIDERPAAPPPELPPGVVFYGPGQLSPNSARVMSSFMNAHGGDGAIKGPVFIRRFDLMGRISSPSTPSQAMDMSHVQRPSKMSAGGFLAGMLLLQFMGTPANVMHDASFAAEVVVRHGPFLYRGTSVRTGMLDQHPELAEDALYKACAGIALDIVENRPWLALPGPFGGFQPDRRLSSPTASQETLISALPATAPGQRWVALSPLTPGGKQGVDLAVLSAGRLNRLLFSWKGKLKSEVQETALGLLERELGGSDTLERIVQSRTFSMTSPEDGVTRQCLDRVDLVRDAPSFPGETAPRRYARAVRYCANDMQGGETDASGIASFAIGSDDLVVSIAREQLEIAWKLSRKL